MFYNLNLLCETVNSLLEDCRSGLERSIDQALSQNNLTGGIESSRKFDAQSGSCFHQSKFFTHSCRLDGLGNI